MKNNIVYILTFLLLVAGCARNNSEKKATSNPETSVETSEVLELQPEKVIKLPGELYPWDKVSIHPKVKGYVKTVYKDRGAKVRKGDLLAQLEAPELTAELDQAHGQLNAAEAMLLERRSRFASSKASYQRLEKASKTKGAISENELEHAYATMLADSGAVQSAIGNLAVAKGHLQSRKELISYLTIRAPFDGTINERNVSPGALIGAGESNKPLFTMENNQKLRLTVPVPEIYSTSIAEAKEVVFSVNAHHARKFKAGFGRSSESIHESHKVVMTEFDITNDQGHFRSGMYAEVELPVKRSKPTLFVPKTSIIKSTEAIFVIKVADSKTEYVPVKEGLVLDSIVEVFGDIRKGDIIVKEASEEIREGQQLQINAKL